MLIWEHRLLPRRQRLRCLRLPEVTWSARCISPTGGCAALCCCYVDSRSSLGPSVSHASPRGNRVVSGSSGLQDSYGVASRFQVSDLEVTSASNGTFLVRNLSQCCEERKGGRLRLRGYQDACSRFTPYPSRQLRVPARLRNVTYSLRLWVLSPFNLAAVSDKTSEEQRERISRARRRIRKSEFVALLDCHVVPSQGESFFASGTVPCSTFGVLG